MVQGLGIRVETVHARLNAFERETLNPKP